MKYYLTHNELQKCWKIHDMQQPETDEPKCMMTVGDELMDRMLTALLIVNGAIDYPLPKKGGELMEKRKRGSDMAMKRGDTNQRRGE